VKPLIYVEGGVGAGKTTVTKALAARLNLRVFEEPVNEELLAEFYADLADGGKRGIPAIFQFEMLHRRYAMQLAAAAECLLPDGTGFAGAILDRCLFGDRVFASILAEDGLITAVAFGVYERAVQNMKLGLYPPTLLLYLDARPETCLDRIRKRGRPQEKDITLAYLQRIHEGYKKLLAEAKTACFPWSHAVRIMHLAVDPDQCSDKDMDRLSATVWEEACSVGHW